MRAALGASTAALRRSLLAESMVLCGSGALAGIAIAAPMVAVLARYASRFSVRADGLTLDFSMVWIGVALALMAAVFPGICSAAACPRMRRADSAYEQRCARHRRKQPAAAHFCRYANHSLVPVAGRSRRAVTTLLALEKTRPPFETAHVLAVNLPVMTYGKTPEQVRDFYREVQRRISALPGVRTCLSRLRRSLARWPGAGYQLYIRRGRRAARKRP